MMDSWTAGGNLNTARPKSGGSGLGLQTAALCAGGHTGTAYINNSEEYNGTSWAEGNNLGTARTGEGSFGIQTASVVALGFGGYDSHTDLTEEYNGTSWTETNNLNTGRNTLAGAAGLMYGW